jgi:hypothetical protein
MPTSPKVYIQVGSDILRVAGVVPTECDLDQVYGSNLAILAKSL